MSKQEEIIDAKRNIETIERKLKNLLDGYDGKDELKNDLEDTKEIELNNTKQIPIIDEEN